MITTKCEPKPSRPETTHSHKTTKLHGPKHFLTIRKLCGNFVRVNLLTENMFIMKFLCSKYCNDIAVAVSGKYTYFT